MATAPARTGAVRVPAPPVTGEIRAAKLPAVAKDGAGPPVAKIPVPGETDAATGRVMGPGTATAGTMAAVLGMTPTSAVRLPAF